MIVTQSGWWLLSQMLQQVEKAQGPGAKEGVSREQIEGAWIPEGLRTALSSHIGAATALDGASHYRVLRVISAEPRLVHEARAPEGESLRLVAVAENTQLVTKDPTTFVPVGDDGRVTDAAECYDCRLEEDHWEALDQGYTFESILPWRWARPFTALGYESSGEIITLEWDGSAEELGDLLDHALGLRPAPMFQVDDMVGRIDERGAWIASRRPNGTYRLCLGGAHRAARSVEEALDDARSRGKRLKPR